ncbi:hypothetical protein EZJ49_13100 [Bdellovibrio bacteriovorus]|uniref:glycine zipper domain-containing protein n=1 Tax=Bdellovibrio bacteriovorus TaxID=959 RepID=UPI0021CE9F01|nr:hypothetical protein [Bdellovibrio bacteriovorus]UXR64001.1 hypothetical protein EZJ49_13100 [Bdellovibrio bacteriovorus]
METTTGEIRKKMGDIKENVAHSLEKSAWSDRYHAVESKVKEGVDASEEFVKAHPFYTVLGAAAVGFVAGALINRKH